MRGVLALSVAFVLGLTAQASIADAKPAGENSPSNDLIHSDLPLFHSGTTEDRWPQPFTESDGFGCTSRVAFGDWAFHQFREDGEEDISWFRFQNYGVFHCFAMVANAEDRTELKQTDFRTSFFVFLGRIGSGENALELWAIQMGARPGSDYLLLSRHPREEIISKFDVLQRDCPRAKMRKGPPLDILITRYCAINSRAELIGLARRMAQLKPLGYLRLAEQVNDRQSENQSPGDQEQGVGN